MLINLLMSWASEHKLPMLQVQKTAYLPLEKLRTRETQESLG